MHETICTEKSTKCDEISTKIEKSESTRNLQKKVRKIFQLPENVTILLQLFVELFCEDTLWAKLLGYEGHVLLGLRVEGRVHNQTVDKQPQVIFNLKSNIFYFTCDTNESMAYGWIVFFILDFVYYNLCKKNMIYSSCIIEQLKKNKNLANSLQFRASCKSIFKIWTSTYSTYKINQ